MENRIWHRHEDVLTQRLQRLSMNTNALIWNAQLTRSFCKGNLVAAITGFDILGQLSSTYYNVNSQGSSEYRVNSLNRYVMLSLKYKFNLGPKK